MTKPQAQQIIFLVALSIFIILNINAKAADQCYDKADPALSQLKTWGDLRSWFENYPGCDDGYFAESVSSFVVISLAKHWDKLPSLKEEINKNNKFKDFVLKHIDFTTDEKELGSVAIYSDLSCPENLSGLCKEIHKNAQIALRMIYEP